MANGNSSSVWKWIAGSLVALIASNLVTAQVFSVSATDIQQAARQAIMDSFTDVSSQRGMYVLEGRPRIEGLENSMTSIHTQLNTMSGRLVKIEAKLDQTIKN